MDVAVGTPVSPLTLGFDPAWKIHLGWSESKLKRHRTTFSAASFSTHTNLHKAKKGKSRLQSSIVQYAQLCKLKELLGRFAHYDNDLRPSGFELGLDGAADTHDTSADPQIPWLVWKAAGGGGKPPPVCEYRQWRAKGKNGVYRRREQQDDAVAPYSHKKKRGENVAKKKPGFWARFRTRKTDAIGDGKNNMEKSDGKGTCGVNEQAGDDGEPNVDGKLNNSKATISGGDDEKPEEEPDENTPDTGKADISNSDNSKIDNNDASAGNGDPNKDGIDKNSAAKESDGKGHAGKDIDSMGGKGDDGGKKDNAEAEKQDQSKDHGRSQSNTVMVIDPAFKARDDGEPAVIDPAFKARDDLKVNK
jgi:hypothetical protein